MAYVPPTPGSTIPGQPTPGDVPKQDVHIADLPPEVRRSFLLSMVFFPTLVGAVICAVVFLGWWTLFQTKEPTQYAQELTGNDARRRGMAARELGEHIGDPRIYKAETLNALITVLQNPALDKEAEQWSPQSMITPSGEVSGSRLRWWAAAMVGHVAAQLPDEADRKRGLDALLKALNEKDLAVFAARGLSFLKDPASREALVAKIQSDPDVAVKAACANAVGAIGAYLIASNKGDDATLKPYREPLRIAYTTETEKDVVDNIAIALARLKDPTGQPRLLELSKSEDAVIRDHAQRALKALSGKEAEVTDQPAGTKSKI
jgi:hypothetical protein